MSAPGHSIFISYTRVDSVYAVDQLDDRLKQALGADAVFRDASSMVIFRLPELEDAEAALNPRDGHASQ